MQIQSTSETESSERGKKNPKIVIIVVVAIVIIILLCLIYEPPSEEEIIARFGTSPGMTNYTHTQILISSAPATISASEFTCSLLREDNTTVEGYNILTRIGYDEWSEDNILWRHGNNSNDFIGPGDTIYIRIDNLDPGDYTFVMKYKGQEVLRTWWVITVPPQ